MFYSYGNLCHNKARQVGKVGVVQVSDDFLTASSVRSRVHWMSERLFRYSYLGGTAATEVEVEGECAILRAVGVTVFGAAKRGWKMQGKIEKEGSFVTGSGLEWKRKKV